jgi:hypothetical protein
MTSITRTFDRGPNLGQPKNKTANYSTGTVSIDNITERAVEQTQPDTELSWMLTRVLLFASAYPNAGADRMTRWVKGVCRVQ